MADVNNSMNMSPSMCPIFSKSDDGGGGASASGVLVDGMFKSASDNIVQTFDMSMGGTTMLGLGFISSIPEIWKHTLGDLSNLGILSKGAELSSLGIIKVLSSVRSGAFGRSTPF